LALESVIRQYAWNLAYADSLTRDVPASKWAESGGPGLENHPAWTLGHLVTGSAMVAQGLGVEVPLPSGWVDLFQRRGPNDSRRPSTETSLYPSRDELMSELTRVHELVSEALRKTSSADLSKVKTEWRFGGYLPTEHDQVLFMLIAHENVHLGQLGCWRRRFGLPSAMGAMEQGPAAP